MAHDQMEFPKQYDSKSVETSLYETWERDGCFTPELLPERNQHGEPFCIMMPPPNRTGTLHIGHAMCLSIQDLLIRFERMRGKRVLWIPGTDHAAISTQVKVEQLLMKEGFADPRRELGREEFLKRVRAFADQSRDTIVRQTRALGASCDWTRERYTLDEERNRAVNQVFAMMFEDGLIERGTRIVNWDPQFQTTLSDDEVRTRETTARLITFRYDAGFPIPIATTRPETKFGDTAVAVHPDDIRYKEYIGQIFHPVFCGKPLTVRVIADPVVDPSFGTGALGVTPAHAMIDTELAERHGLRTEQVINTHGRMMDVCGSSVAGKTIQEAREIVEACLREQGTLIATKDVQQALPIAERGGAVVEQLPSQQWFVRVNKPFVLRQDTLGKWRAGDHVTLKELMLYAVRSDQIQIVPERFVGVYEQWIEHLRDWCISRQIWFGHRIPMWYLGDETRCSQVSPGPEWEQDPDTLDTWFSSGLWTFSALGWPDPATWGAHRAWHPTSVLETGRDIIFFWVARMVLMSSYALGEVPFRQVYFHGLVLDGQGRKMSKSLGNVLDPLEFIPKYGTDAVRLSLIIGTTPGQDICLSEAKIEGFRNFANKLWNIARFVDSQSDRTDRVGTLESVDPSHWTLADQWIISRLDQTIRKVTQLIETRAFSQAGEVLREFTWNTFADWYIEAAKIEGNKTRLLQTVLQTVLRLWHPFMPFVTEEIWRRIGEHGWLMLAEWPQPFPSKWITAQAFYFDEVCEIVTTARSLKAEQGMTRKDRPRCVVRTMEGVPADRQEAVQSCTSLIESLAGVEVMSTGSPVDQTGWSQAGKIFHVSLQRVKQADRLEELSRLEQEIQHIKETTARYNALLADPSFCANAPQAVVERTREQAEASKRELQTLEAKKNRKP